MALGGGGGLILITLFNLDNTVNILNIRIRMCSQQENLYLYFPPQDANSNEVISSDRIWVGPGIYVQ